MLKHTTSVSGNWLNGRLTSPFSKKIGYIGNKVLGGDLVPKVKDGQRYSNLPTPLRFCLAMTQMGKHRGSSKLLH